MPEFKITVYTEMSEALLKLDHATENLRKDCGIIMLEETTTAVAISKFILCPVDKGILQASIGIIEWLPDILEIVAGALAGHAGFVEFGHYTRGRRSYVHARPFWRPPIWEAFYRIRERVLEQIKEYWR